MRKIIIVTLFLVLAGIAGREAVAQETVWYTGKAAMFREANELFRKKEYGAAAKLFKTYVEKYGKEKESNVEQARYYIAMSSVHLKSPFALQQLTGFAADYPESSFLPSVNLAMGNLFFQQHKYSLALESFSKVSPSELTKPERAELFYKKGFSYMKKNKPDEALENFSKSMNYKGRYADASSFYYAHIQYQKKNYDEALKYFKPLEKNRRFKALIPPYYMDIYYEKGDFDKVIDEGIRFYKNAGRKSKPELARIIANAYYEKGDYANALEYFKLYEQSARHGISADEQYRIAYCKFKNGLYREAVPNFQKAITGDTKMAQTAWYYLGFCYRNSGEDRFAQKAFLKSYKLKNDPEITVDALFAYAKLTIEVKGDPYNDAVSTVQDFILENNDRKAVDEAYNLLVQLYLVSRNYKAALQSIEHTKNPNRLLRSTYQKLAYAQGVELYSRNDFKGAIEYFSASMKYPADDELVARALFWKGDAFYRLRQFPQAAEYYSKFLKARKAMATGLVKRAYYNLAYTQFNMKKYDAALSGFKKVLSFSSVPVNIMNDAQLRLADCYFMTKRFDEALAWYDKASTGGRTDSDYALYQKAFCYAAMEKYRKKIDELKKLTARFPHSSYYDDALYEIATTYSALNEQREAIVYFDKIVKNRPKSPYAKKALIKMGMVYYKNNQYDRAIETLKKAVSRYPASQEATIALSTLESIYKDKGEPEKYFAYVKTLDFVQISKSEEDSVTFSMGEEQYLEHDCSKAIRSLTRYLQNFPDGGFVLKAHYYLARCYEKTDDNDLAYSQYQKVLSYPDNDYTVKSLLAAARLAYDRKEYEKSLEWYKKLFESAQNKSTVLEAEDGVMRTAFMLKDYNLAAEYARKLLKTPKVSDDQIVYAHYILGKSAMLQGNKTEAFREFNVTDKLTTGERGAEAKYYLAQINFDEGKDKEAENQVYELSEQYPDFEYWVAKGFILLSDIYVKRKNYFQARETLKSIINNYSGEDLKEVARTKLALIPKDDNGTNTNQGNR